MQCVGGKNIKNIYSDWQTHGQRTDHPHRLTSVSSSQRTWQLSSTGFKYQLPHEEPRQPGHSGGCTALNQRSGPSVGHWPGSRGAPAWPQWRRSALKRRVHHEKKCCCFLQDDSLRDMKQTVCVSKSRTHFKIIVWQTWLFRSSRINNEEY